MPQALPDEYKSRKVENGSYMELSIGQGLAIFVRINVNIAIHKTSGLHLRNVNTTDLFQILEKA